MTAVSFTFVIPRYYAAVTISTFLRKARIFALTQLRYNTKMKILNKVQSDETFLFRIT